MAVFGMGGWWGGLSIRWIEHTFTTNTLWVQTVNAVTGGGGGGGLLRVEAAGSLQPEEQTRDREMMTRSLFIIVSERKKQQKKQPTGAGAHAKMQGGRFTLVFALPP